MMKRTVCLVLACLGSACGVVVVNNGGQAYAGTPALRDGWRVTRALTDDSSLAKWEDGKLTLAPCAGILLMAEQEPAR